LPFNWRKGISGKNANNKLEAISWLQQGFDFLKKNNNLILDLSPTELYNKNVKLIMGMVWQFILKFQIIDKKLILKWAKKAVSHCGVVVSRDYRNDILSFAHIYILDSHSILTSLFIHRFQTSQTAGSMEREFVPSYIF
tara:strand:- start:972 stop:1388 length:417 start_codon:yes stop_codon:yes gene_type:complete